MDLVAETQAGKTVRWIAVKLFEIQNKTQNQRTVPLQKKKKKKAQGNKRKTHSIEHSHYDKKEK